MIIYILYAITAVIIAGESARMWFGKQTFTVTIIKTHGPRVKQAALAGLIAATLWALAAVWFSDQGIMSYDTEFYGDIFCFWVVFFGGILYAHTSKPIVRRKRTMLLVVWLIALVLVLASCGTAVSILTDDFTADM